MKSTIFATISADAKVVHKRSTSAGLHNINISDDTGDFYLTVPATICAQAFGCVQDLPSPYDELRSLPDGTVKLPPLYGLGTKPITREMNELPYSSALDALLEVSNSLEAHEKDIQESLCRLCRDPLEGSSADRLCGTCVNPDDYDY